MSSIAAYASSCVGHRPIALSITMRPALTVPGLHHRLPRPSSSIRTRGIGGGTGEGVTVGVFVGSLVGTGVVVGIGVWLGTGVCVGTLVGVAVSVGTKEGGGYVSVGTVSGTAIHAKAAIVNTGTTDDSLLLDPTPISSRPLNTSGFSKSTLSPAWSCHPTSSGYLCSRTL